MRAGNHIVHGLWIGSTLSPLELLTLHSYIAHGHEFQLWAYDDITTPLPPGVVLKRASDIIPAECIFRYQHTNTFGHGKGSVSGFSDIFRYKLLYEHGGWWTDMDVTCLKPLDIEEPYFFRKHHLLKVVGNVMKCPPQSQLMADSYEEANRLVTADNRDWHLPIEILARNIVEHGLEEYIKGGLSNTDDWTELKKFLYRHGKIPENYYLIHWMNEEWRLRGLDKHNIRIDSTLGDLLSKYGLAHHGSFLEDMSSRFRFSKLYDSIHGLRQHFKRGKQS